MLFTYKATERARFPCSWRRVDFLRSGNFCIKYPAVKPCHNAAPKTIYSDPIYTQGTAQEPSRQKLLCNADWHWKKPDVNVVTNSSCHLQYVAHCPLQLTVLSWKNSWPVNKHCVWAPWHAVQMTAEVTFQRSKAQFLLVQRGWHGRKTTTAFPLHHPSLFEGTLFQH